MWRKDQGDLGLIIQMTAKFQRSRDALGGVVEESNKEGHCSSVSGVLAGYCREGGWLGRAQMDSMRRFENILERSKWRKKGRKAQVACLLPSQA